MRLDWTLDAIEDRHLIYTHIEADNPLAALDLDEALAAAAERLRDQPALGRPGRVAGTREWVVHPNYLLIYELYADSLVVLRVLHAARRWP